MMNSILRNKNKLFIILFWILVWEILSLIIGQEIYLPSPHAAFSSLINLLTSKETYITICYSTYRTLAGFFLSCLFRYLAGDYLRYPKALVRFVQPFDNNYENNPRNEYHNYCHNVVQGY